ncbi:hypothetical protein MFIFM68171_04894 [Madurella fahalii]|uniref:Rhodopsin domain-containing protein n=1 Tax=Madurella fahalii TaxID=1157608 RepID=A0ABQ0GAI3_9PEZI
MAVSNATAALPPDENQGPMLIGVVLVLFVFTFIVYAARIWFRLSSGCALTVADYAITVAMIAKTMCIGFMIAAIHQGFGRHTAHIEPANMRSILSNLLGVFMTGVATSGTARISIASLLLRFTMERTWRIVLWILIALQVSNILAYEIVKLAQCQLVIAGQALLRKSRCFPKTQVWALNYTNVVICMLSDLVCTALPIFVVWHLSRSVVEKTLVIILIASCLIATACSIPKIYYLATYDFNSDDRMWHLVPEFFWCRIEEGMIIIAACVPLLKGPIERCLRRFGLPQFDSRPRTLTSIDTRVLGNRVKGGWPDEGQRQWSIPSDVEGVVITRTGTREREAANSGA